jgi:hypothetical protein
MVIQPGDVLFVWKHSLLSDLIEAITNGPSHVGIFKDENTIIDAQGGRLVGECSLSFYLDGKTRCEVWTDPELTEGQRQQMIEYAKTLYGVPYDYMLIPLELLHYEAGVKIDWFKETHHFICSSLVYDLAAHVGLKWADSAVCAPEGLIDFSKLQKKGDLVQTASLAVS